MTTRIKRINSLDELRKWLHEEWGMDQPDSSDITNSVATLMKTVKTIDTISTFNKEQIEEWKKLTEEMDKKGDTAKCPKCKEPMIFCGCMEQLAQEIMESLFYRELKAI
jgi:peptide subunit release factor 1 (eRF1)